MMSFFKIYKDVMLNAPVNQVYSITGKFRTDIREEYAINFDLDAFTNRKISSNGEIKLPKGLWIFDIKFECDIANINNSTLLNWQVLHSIDFGVQAYLNNTIQNDRSKFLYSGSKNSTCNYQFAVANKVDDALFKVEFTPKCWQHGSTNIQELDRVHLIMKDFSLSGTMFSNYENLPLAKNIEEKEGDKTTKKNKTSTPQ